MPSYQYIYVMNGLSKTFTGGREILKNKTTMKQPMQKKFQKKKLKLIGMKVQKKF